MSHAGALSFLQKMTPALALLTAALVAALYFGALQFGPFLPVKGEPETLLPGVTAEPLAPPTAGLVVTSVRYESEAQDEGVSVGDHILTVNDLPARAGKNRQYYLTRTSDGLLRLQLRHDHSVRTVVLHPVAR